MTTEIKFFNDYYYTDNLKQDIKQFIKQNNIDERNIIDVSYSTHYIDGGQQGSLTSHNAMITYIKE